MELLKARGLGMTDDAAALLYLEQIGYYRLSAYWYSFRETSLTQDPVTQKITVHRENEFCPGTRFEHALDLYIFDKRLRLLVLDAIERIEVALRVAIAYQVGAHDPFAYTKPELLHGAFTKKLQARTGKTGHQEWLDRYNQVLGRSKEDFVQHYKQKYDLLLPIWVSVEIWEFGMLSTFYKGMTIADKSAIAMKYGIPDWRVMESWLRSMNFVRNVAAHHSRLWNKNLVDQPKMPARGDIPSFDPLIGKPDITARLYVVICILMHFMDKVSPNSSWRKRMRSMIDGFPAVAHLSVADMGFPPGWKNHPFWQSRTSVCNSCPDYGK
ncbi:Abi family protein [Verminephrobacter aporrectodeae]|uniref:Abi family protein n=1 Tax=Verminephrobacter aporrectodeae TaxID=1110389 RepID=UPI00191BE1B4|nr:Abi family protein [Verminephrobacter aporrectodeae]